MNNGSSPRFLLRAVLCVVVCGLSTACAHVVSFPPGPITISGVVNDATGLPLANQTVRLSHGFEYMEAATDAKGAYAFANLAPGSYTVRPRLRNCHFLPPKADLDRLTSSTVQNFGGFGPACGGEPTVNMGAMTGPLTVSGHIRDAAGRAVVGARVDLDDDTRAIRFTDVTGGYAFHVRSEEYKLRASGACAFTPAGTVRRDVKANVVVDFAAGAGCVTSSQSNVTATGSVLTVEQGGVVLGRTYVRVENRAGPGDALARLTEIVEEHPAVPARTLTIAGNPAIERQTSVALPGPQVEISGSSGEKPAPFLAITTAIAVGNTVVRFESQLAGDADAATIARFLQVGRNFTPDQIPNLHGPLPTPNPMTQNTPPGPPAPPGISAAGVLPGGSFGELQVAASDTANVVVYGTPNGPFLSTNGGQTIQAATFNTVAAPPSAAFTSLGDPTVAVGAPNASFAQTIYFAQLQPAAPPPTATGKAIVAIGLYQSTNNGVTFNNTSLPVNCSVAAAGCVIPDQPQLAADRINRAVTAAGSFDQLYVAWRNFTSQTTNAHTIAVACSQDGGANWNVDLTTLATTGAEFPRINVGPDGTLIVAYSIIAAGGATYSLRVQKWGSCASGFQPGDTGVVVKTVTEVTDMPGLDRPPQGNYSPAFENTFRVYVVYSSETSAGNDDIRVAESVDAGKTWTRDSIVSTSGIGRKYFPWVCSTVGKNFVTWYDRRKSTAATPDFTAYFRSSVFDNGSTTSVGIGPEINVSGVNDPQCLPGFPNQVRGTVEETGCTNLPAGFIQGGTCQRACGPGATPPCGTLAACDFRAAPSCTTTGETCTAGNTGVPKYGDYNGAGCALGTLFVAWASAAPASGTTCLVNGLPAANASLCCSGVLSGGTCAATAATCTANGGACGPGLAPCCSTTGGLTGQCQAGVCLPAITMYTGSSCLGPACAGAPVTITYHQTGACDSFVIPPAVSAGPNAAFVIFGIERINNAFGTTTFNFDPDRVFVQQTGPRFFDSSLQLYPNVLGTFAITPATIAAGTDRIFNVSGQGGLIVTTTTLDGAVEANQTPYPLSYNRQPTDPPVTLVKSDATRTSWPLTQDCKTIQLK